MIAFRTAAKLSLLLAATLCAGCANSTNVVADGGSPEMDVVKLSEHDLHPDGVPGGAAADAKPTSTPSLVTQSKESPDARVPYASTAGLPAGARDVSVVAPGAGSAAAAANSSADPNRELLGLIAEIQGMGALDAAAQQALLNDLKQSDPALWPQLVRQFRTALAYRKQMADRAAGQPPANEPPSAATATDNSDPPSRSHNAPRVALASAVGQCEPDATASDTKSAAAPDAAPKRPTRQKIPADANLTAKPLPKPAASDNKSVSQASHQSSGPAPVSPESSAALDDWQARLAAATLSLDGPSADASSAAAEIQRQLRLRFLYLLSGRRDDAMRPISGMSPAEQEFWSKELYGLATYLDSQKTADPQRRATEATMHLGEAVARLGELATPVVRNLAFCRSVTSYGRFERFPQYAFKPGDEVLLYCELENLKAESTDRGYHTTLKGSYQILDGHGQSVAQQDLPPIDDICSNPRRDFFIPYDIWLPKRIISGPYTLQLTIEDGLSNKVGQSSIQFSVK